MEMEKGPAMDPQRLTFVLTSENKVTHYCRAAAAEIASQRLIRLTANGCLRLVSSELDAALPRLIDSLRSGERSRLCEVVTCQVEDETRAVKIKVAGLVSPGRLACVDRRQPIDITVEIDLDSEATQFASEACARAYSLTPAETQLCAMLHAGTSLQEAGRRARVTTHTIRDRLKRVFQKTDTHRQAELVTALARFSYQ